MTDEGFEPIYEKLLPGEIYILSKKGDYIRYAVNENGYFVINEVHEDCSGRGEEL